LVNSPGNPWSQSRRKGRQWWEGFAEKKGFKPGMKEQGGVVDDESGQSMQPMGKVPLQLSIIHNLKIWSREQKQKMNWTWLTSFR